MATQTLDMLCLALRTTPGLMRTLVEFRLIDWGLIDVRQGDLADACYLVTAELVTNGCNATPDSEIRFRFTLEDTSIYVGSWDSSNDLPLLTPFKDLTLETLDLTPEHFDDNGGNGLPM